MYKIDVSEPIFDLASIFPLSLIDLLIVAVKIADVIITSLSGGYNSDREAANLVPVGRPEFVSNINNII